MPGRIRSRYSSTVTSAPSRFQTEPSSSPITPCSDDDEVLRYWIVERFGAGPDGLHRVRHLVMVQRNFRLQSEYAWSRELFARRHLLLRPLGQGLRYFRVLGSG